MLIDKKQVDQLGEEFRLDFDRRALTYLSKIKPDWGNVEPAILAPLIDGGVAQCAKLSITREADVICYIEMLLRLGAKRWSSPSFAWISEYLGEKRPANERLSLVIERLRFDSEASG